MMSNAMLWEMYRDAANEKLSDNRLSEAKPLLDAALKEAQRHGSSNACVAYSLEMLGWYYLLRDRYPEAIERYLDATKIRMTVGGTCDISVISALIQLGEHCYRNKSMLETSELFLRRALLLCENTYDSEHPDTLSVLYHLAQLSVERREYPQAQIILDRVLSIKARKLGSAHPQVFDTLVALCRLSVLRRDSKESVDYFRRSLDIISSCSPTEFMALLSSIVTLSGVIPSQEEDLRLGKILWLRASCIEDMKFKSVSLRLAQAFIEMADKMKSGRKPILQAAKNLLETCVPSTDSRLLSVCASLAAIFRANGDLKASAPLDIRILKSGVDLPGYQSVSELRKIAYLYEQEHLYQAAEAFYLRAIRVAEEIEQEDGDYVSFEDDEVFDLSGERVSSNDRDVSENSSYILRETLADMKKRSGKLPLDMV